MVTSIKTPGASLNWYPHVHALVTCGLVERGGRFVPLSILDERVLMEKYRRLVLAALRKAARLSERFHDNLLWWRRSGFSVWALAGRIRGLAKA